MHNHTARQQHDIAGEELHRHGARKMHPSSQRVALNSLPQVNATARTGLAARGLRCTAAFGQAGARNGQSPKREHCATDGASCCPDNGSINNGLRTTSMRTTGSSGSMALLSEYDDATGRELRSLRLESTEDGKGILLIEVDERKPGIHREVRYEITPAELIAAIRAHGAE